MNETKKRGTPSAKIIDNVRELGKPVSYEAIHKIAVIDKRTRDTSQNVERAKKFTNAFGTKEQYEAARSIVKEGGAR